MEQVVVAEENSSSDFYAAILMGGFGWLRSMIVYWDLPQGCARSRAGHPLLGGATWPLVVPLFVMVLLCSGPRGTTLTCLFKALSWFPVSVLRGM